MCSKAPRSSRSSSAFAALAFTLLAAGFAPRLALAQNLEVMPYDENVNKYGSSTVTQVFQVHNAYGSATSFSLWCWTTGSMPSGCTVSGGATQTLANNTWTNITVTFSTNAPYSTGVVNFGAQLIATEEVVYGSVNVTSVPAPTPTPNVTPENTSQSNVTPNSSQLRAFTIQNPGSISGYYQLKAICSGGAVASGCLFAGDVSEKYATIGAGASRTDTIYFTSGGYTTTGTVKLSAVGSTSGSLPDTGAFSISTTVAVPAVAVTPDNQSLSTGLINSSSNHTFTVTNTGTLSTTFSASATCTGSALTSSCTPASTSFFLSAGNSTTVSVPYTYSGTHSATGKLQFKAWVTSTSTIVDSGWVNVSSSAPPSSVNVSGDGSNVSFWVDSAQFYLSHYLSNTSSVPGTFNLSVACPALASCSVSQSSVYLQPSETVGVGVTATTGHTYGASGVVQVMATVAGAATVKDSGWVNFTIPSAPVPIATPDGGSALVRAPQTQTSYQLTLQNTGAHFGRFQATAVCTGALSNCSASGTGAPWWVGGGGGGSVAPYAIFTPGTSGSTGRFIMRFTEVGDAAIKDSAWFDVQGASTQALVTPKDTLLEPAPSASSTATFTIKNVGNSAATYTLTAACTGSAVASGCSLSTSSVTLDPNATTTATVTYTSGARGAPGRIRVLATPGEYATLTDSGWVILSVESHPAVVVTPDGTTQTLKGDSAWSTVFKIKNTGDATDTYALSMSCPGNGFATQCVLSSSTATLSPGDSTTRTVSTITGRPGTSGRMMLTATSGIKTNIKDSGWVDLTMNASHWLRITPAGSARVGIAPGSTQTFNFVVSTNRVGGYYLRPTCEGTALSCGDPAQSGLNVSSPGDNTVQFFGTAGATGTIGRIKVKILPDSPDSLTLATEGWFDLSVGTAPTSGVAVSPKGSAVSGVRASFARIDTFFVTNTGTGSATYALAADCTGEAVATSCTLALTSLTIAAGAWAAVPVSYTTGGRSKVGRVRLLALTGSVADSGWKTISTVLEPLVEVTPKGVARYLYAGDSEWGQGFGFTNLGSTTQTFVLRPTCWGQAFGTSCVMNEGDSVRTLLPGEKSGGTVVFGNGGHGGTGRVRLDVIPVSDPTRLDSGWVDVTATSQSIAALLVMPHGGLTYVTPNDSTLARFEILNSGTVAPLEVSITVSCTGTAQCASTTSTEAFWYSSVKLFKFKAGAVGQTGRVKVVVSQVGNSSVSDSGWFDVSTGTSDPATIVVSPDNGTTYVAPGWAGLHRDFVASNNSTSAGTFNFSAVCSGSAFYSGAMCTPQYASKFLLPRQSVQLRLYFSTGFSSALTGRMTLHAQNAASSGVRDSGWINVGTYTPTVQITPQGSSKVVAAGVTSTVTFTIKNTGQYADQFQPFHSCEGVTGCSTSGGSASLAPGQTTTATVPFTAGAAGSTGRVMYRSLASGALIPDSGWFNITVPDANTKVIVSPDNGTLAGLTNSQATTAVFSVHHLASTSGTYTLTPTCTWNSASMSCTANPTSTTLATNAEQFVAVSFTPGATGTTGTVKLVATLNGSNPTVADSGSINLATGSTPTGVLHVSVTGLNAAGSISRNQCLTIAAGDAAAYECADLRLAHGLPAVTTMNTTRAPTLVYNSRHAKPISLIAADLTLAYPAPSSVTSVLKITGKDSTNSTFTWNASCTAKRCRTVVPVDAQAKSLATGWYPYTLEARAVVGSTTYNSTDSARLVVVDRRLSPFGAGWWLDGLEELKFPVAPADTTTRLWIGGDGSTRIYRRIAADTVYVLDDVVDRPDTLVKAGSVWRRLLPGGGYVEFNNSGQHARTVNRSADTTKFVWSGSKLSTITLPVPSGSSASRVYTFNYTNDLLTSVTSPGPTGGTRTTSIARAGSSTLDITGITDPDTKTTSFRYDTAHKITRRVNKLSDSVTYDYGTGGTLMQVTQHMRTDSALVTTFCAAETRSLHECADGTQVKLQPLDSVFTRVDGPRTDVNDITRFVINRFGAPDVIINALNGRTTITRDQVFPALAYKVVDPALHEVRAFYNSRGLLETHEDVNPLGDNQVARTLYEYDSKWPTAIKVTSPTGQVTRDSVDFATGNRLWTQIGSLDSTRTRFTYDSHQRVTYIQEPKYDTLHRQRFEYDAVLGNIWRVTSPLGFISTILTDSIGRKVTSTSPIDGTLVRTGKSTYDAMDRVLVQTDSGPPVSYNIDDLATGTSAAAKLIVTNSYDDEGNLLSTTRESSPSTPGVGTLVSSWTYDAAHRKRTDALSAGINDSLFYDKGGNVVRTRTRRGNNIMMTYDALGRLTSRVTPSVTRASDIGNDHPSVIISHKKPRFPYYGANGYVYDPQASNPPTTPDLVIAADTATFTYDAAGRMLTAINKDAAVRRGYFPGGALKADTLVVAAADTGGTANTYALGFTYDLSGRRLSRTDNAPGSYPTGACACTQTYEYHSQTGLLTKTTDRGSNFTFGYDAAMRMRTSRSDSTASERAFTFDEDGRLTLRTVTATGTNSQIYNDDMTYDQAGRVITSNNASQTTFMIDETEHAYSALGAVVATKRKRNSDILIDAYRTDAFGNVRSTRKWKNSSLYGAVDTTDMGGERLLSRRGIAPVLDPEAAEQIVDTTVIGYDSAGNATFNLTQFFRRTNSDTIWSYLFTRPVWVWNAYGADEKLRVSQRSWREGSEGHNPRTSFTMYRYDALGRRVLSWTRQDQYCTAASNTDDCHSTVERTVWDGDQALAELKADVAASAVGSGLDVQVTGGAFAGAVRYTHAGGIDEPLAIWKASDQGYLPMPSWRGMYEAVRNIDGSLNSDLILPGRIAGAYFEKDGRGGDVTPNKWIGNIVTGKADPSGLLYMRNRYYDPKTGRFTQEDPIGLAGGMNLYGFAGGDPINFSDPFGLCRVRVGWTPVLGNGRHAFIEVTPPDASKVASVFRGGPTDNAFSESIRGESKDGKVTAFGSVNAREWTKGSSVDRDSPRAVAYDKPLVDDDAPCGKYKQSFRSSMKRINDADRPYDISALNSNSVVNQMLLDAGLGGLRYNQAAPAGRRTFYP